MSSVTGLQQIDHRLTVPLIHDAPDGRTLSVYAREVRLSDGADRPALLYLQGGPGGESPRPNLLLHQPSWLERALQDFRVILLDQRGTGLSDPVGDPPDRPPGEVAEQLTHYRADSIVRDAELLREELGIDRWSLLGQSFGGFCSLHYLTRFPGSVRESFFTGGLPPVGMPVRQVYADTFARTMELSRRHHRRFPQDAARMQAVLERCDRGEILLPNRTPLCGRQLRSLGHQLGMTGGSEAIHLLLERDPRSPGFRHGVAALLPFTGSTPLYAVLHESSYADGGVTGWAAEHAQPDEYAQDSTLFTAEHLFRWHFEQDPELRGWLPVADQLAAHVWPRLYDAEILREVDIPCAAAIYVDDPFVLEEHSRATASLLPGLRPWITNEWLHNGLRASGADVLDRLITLARTP